MDVDDLHPLPASHPADPRDQGARGFSEEVTALRILDQRIGERTTQIATAHGHWPCRRGCDACCRRLADVPQLTAPERARLEQGVALLVARIREAVLQRIENLTAAERPLTCPFLDLDSGACHVYEHRPIACRTYGFYRERDRGLYCAEMEERVSRGEMDNVVWGNHASIESAQDTLGERLPLVSR